MSFARYLWDSYSVLVDAQGGWEDADATEVEKKDSSPVSLLSSAVPEHTSQRKEVDQNDQLQQEASSIPVLNDYQAIISHPIYQDLVGQNQSLQQENIRHLRWQDEASMAIKNLEEEEECRKREARAAM